MARGVTETDVHTAADELVAQGERPTVERVRAHLGTGSPNTVTRWLDTWWQGLGRRLQAHATFLEIPAAPESVSLMAGRFWQVALAHADELAQGRLAEQGLRLQADQVALEAMRTALSEENERLREHADASAQTAALAQARNEELHRLVAQLETQLEQAHQQHTAQKTQLEEAQRELAILAQRLHAQHEAFEQQRSELTQHLRATEDRAHREVDRARQEAKTLAGQLAIANKQQAAAEKAWRVQMQESEREAQRHAREATRLASRAEALQAQLSQLPAALRSALKANPTRAGATKSVSARSGHRTVSK